VARAEHCGSRNVLRSRWLSTHHLATYSCRQLALVAEDLRGPSGDAYAKQQEAAQAVLERMEARAAAIRGGAPL